LRKDYIVHSLKGEKNEMRKDLVVFRCKGCIEDLKDLNPYVDSKGKAIPLDRIEVIEVPNEFCENTENNLNSSPRFQAPIMLDDYPERPWRVVVWNSIYDREQGISEIFGWYETFAEARDAIEEHSLSKYWASYEIQLDNEEENIVVYHYANCRPLADEFIKIPSGQSSNTSVTQTLKKYKIYVHFEGCIDYDISAINEEDAKYKALSLYEEEKPEYIIDKLIHKVCDCELQRHNDNAMSYDRAMCLLSEIVEHTCVARNTSDAIEELFRLGFTDDELKDVAGFSGNDVDAVVNKIEEDDR